MRDLKHTCEEKYFLLPFNSSLQVIHYFNIVHGLKLFHLQDLRANLQQVWEYDGNRLSIVFLQPYEDPFEWKIAWRTSGINRHRRPATQDRGGDRPALSCRPLLAKRDGLGSKPA